MAQLAIAAAGAVAGNALGLGISALGLSGAAVGWTIGTLIGASFTPRQKSEGPRLNDLKVTGTDYGQVIPYVVGSPRIAGQLVWASDRKETATTTEYGKGGGGTEVTAYGYEVDVLYILSENQIAGISRIWSNSELVFSSAGTASDKWTRLTIYTGAEDQLPDPVYEAAVGVNNAVAYRTMGSVFIEGLKLGNTGVLPNLTFELGTVAGTIHTKPLTELVTELLNTSEMDMSAVSIEPADVEVRGYSISQLSPARNAIEQLQIAFNFDVVSSDKIYFKSKNSTSVATIPYSDLGFSNSLSTDSDVLKFLLRNETELVTQFSVQYLNILADHQTGSEMSDRLASDFESSSNTQLALCLTPSEAKSIANRLLFDQVNRLHTIEIRTSFKYGFIEPCDVISVLNEDSSRIYKIRVTDKTDFVDHIQFKGYFDPEGLDQISLVSDQTDQSTIAVLTSEPTGFEILDIPALRDIDSELGYYAFAYGTGTGLPTEIWPGAVMSRSWDDSLYERIGEFTREGIFGETTTVLGDWSSNVYDSINQVTVDVGYYELTSSTRTDIINDSSRNLCLIGNEIMQFTQAELISSGVYKLSGFIRSRRGTEEYTATHSVGERFVLLSSNSLIRLDSQNQHIGVNHYLKAVSYGDSIQDISPVLLNFSAISSKPFSVAHLQIDRDTSSFGVKWIRRTKRQYKYSGTSGFIIPLGEIEEKYRVKVKNGTTLLRTEDVFDNHYTYDSVKQTEDSVLSGTTITFEVCQLNQEVGEGFYSTIQGTV